MQICRRESQVECHSGEVPKGCTIALLIIQALPVHAMNCVQRITEQGMQKLYDWCEDVQVYAGEQTARFSSPDANTVCKFMLVNMQRDVQHA